MSRSRIRVNGNRRSVVIASAVLALCMVGGLGHAHGLELTNAVLYPEARMLTATFDADVDPDSVDASKFYIREAGFATGGIQLAGSAAFANGAVVSLFLTDAHVAAQERIYSKRLAIETGAVASAAGEQFDAAFGIGTAFFAGAVSVQAVDAGSDGLGFSRDGTKMFVGDYNNHIREYALGTAFDVSSARLVGNSPRLDDSTGHFAFSPDGSRLFVSLDGSQIRQYDTAAPFDTSNLTDAGSLSVGSEYSLLYGIALSADGRNVFVADGDDGQIRQYGLPSPFDLAGASYAAALDLAPQEITPTSFAFGKDGTRMLILDDKDAVFEYALPNAFNLTGAVYGGTFIDLGSAENDNTANALGLAFDNDGRKMFVVNSPDHFAVSEYVLGTFGMEVLDETASTIRATANPDAAFVTTWQTTSANEEIMIPTDGMGGSYTVTWGDASISTHVVGDQTHVYKEPGTYLVSIYGDFTRIYLPYHPENSLKLLSIEQWGDIRWESMRGAFNGATNMVYRATDTPDLSAVTDTSEMLRFALRFNGNLSNWDVSSVTDMSDMFSIAGAFNGDISTWNVSSVTDMSNMFLATNSFDQNLGNWYVVLHDTSISGANEKLAISAQNAYLDGQNPTYAVDDPLFVVTGGALSIKPGLSVPPGSYEVTVTSTGGFGQGNSKKVEISVGAAQANNPPTVDAGQDQTVDEGDAVTLSGTASDPEGDHLTYLWSHDSALSITVSNTTSQLTTFTAPAVNSDVTVTFVLSVSDGTNTDVTDQVTITIQDVPANNPPTVDAGQDQTVDEGDAVTLSGTASDPEGDHLTYLWSHDSALPITVSNATSQLTTFTAPAVNSDVTVTFVLSVSDGTNTDVTDQVTITIQDVPINNPPTVDAGQDQTVDEGDAVTLSGTASDPEGDHLTYLWSHDSALSITVSNATSQLTTFTAPAVDSDATVTFVLSVSDGTNTDVTDHVTVTIQDVPANNPPTVDAGQDRAVNEGDTLTLNGTASDADGDALTYLWSHDSDLEIILDNPSSVSVSFTVPQVTSNATITFTMTVTDKHNSTGSDAVVISILDIPADDSQDPIAYQFQTNTVVWNMSDPHDSRDISRITLSSVTSGIIHATWEIPNEAPANYRISWAKAGESYLTWTDLTGNAFPTDPSHTITGLRDGEAYKVKVRASYAGTSGDWSDDVTITVTETVSNTPATGLPVIGGTVQVGQTLTVDTSGIADMNGMVNATLSYQWVSSDGATDTDIAEATTSRYVLTDGDQGRVIKVQVTFTDDAGHAESRTSDTTLTVAPASTVPGIPTGLNVLQGNSGTLNVSWQIPISDGGSAITGYTIQWKAASGNWTVPADVSEATATGTTHTITGLTDGTPYTVRIIATNHVGDGEPTPESTATPMTSQQLGPRDIGRVTLSSTTPGAIDASWVAPTETPAAYRVSWANVGGSYKTWTDLSGNAFPTATSQTITGLEEGEAYKVKVRATYAGTSGDWSGDVISTVTETVTNTLTIGPPAVQIGDDQTVGEGDTVRLSGFATDPDDDPITYTWSQTDPTTPLITFANASAPSTTFTAPSVTGDTVFTLVLTADDGTYSATDTLSITVKETGTAFITTWTASDSDRSITLPMEGTYSILWGDGSHADVSGSQSHTYGTVGNYTVTVLGDGLESSNLRNDTVNALQLRSIEQWGSTEWTSMDRAFYGAKNMVYRATDVPDLSRVTDTTYMFFNATSFDGDLSSWDVSGVTKMSGMFSDTTSFNGDISSWDVSRVTDMDSMFLSAASFNGDLSSWNVSGVTDMDSMFFETRSFNGDLSAWDVSGVTEMFAMFHDATSFNGDISAWDVSGVTDMSTMFHEASRFNGDLSAWNVSGVTDMNTMFDRAISFNGDLSAWNVSGVTDMNAMFYRATSFNGNLSSWDVSKVIKMIYMFRGATSFNGDISSWDVSGVTDMSGMFHGATSFNGDISSWDVSGVTDMSGMFHGATSFNQNLGAWYIVLDGDTMPSSTDSIGIAAQNLMLNGQNPVYTIDEAATNGDKFRIANGTHLTLRADQTVVQGQYNVTIKSTGSFGVDNSRIVEITVSEDAVPQTNNPPSVEAGQTQVVPEGSKVHLKGSATDPDGDQITYSWSHDSTQDISLANASAPSTTFTAPQVTGDTVFTLVLTANDGTYSATDTLNVTVKETGTAFITTWAASDSDRSITLPIKGAYSILWGDGTYSANVGGHQSHTYGAAGTYTVTVLGEGLERIRLYDDSANARQLGSIEQWGDTKWISMYESFYGAVNMVYRATDAPNLSRVTDMNRMFAGATAINGDLSGWDVSSVTDMSSMFYTAYAFNGDLSGWDVSSVTTMRYMFFGAHAFNGDLSGWDVSSVTTMNGMFASAHVFNGNLSGWDVSSVTDMGSMFYEAVIFSQPLDGWDVSSVTDMDGMFHSAYTFNQSLDDWDVSSVTYMRNMFYDTVAFNQNLGTWYIVPAGTDFDAGDNSLIVTTVSAQNLYLGDHNLTYGIGSGGDSDLFEMTGSTLAFKSAPNAGSYTVKVTASGNGIFENGNNWRMLEITVHDSADG